MNGKQDCEQLDCWPTHNHVDQESLAYICGGINSTVQSTSSICCSELRSVSFNQNHHPTWTNFTHYSKIKHSTTASLYPYINRMHGWGDSVFRWQQVTRYVYWGRGRYLELFFYTKTSEGIIIRCKAMGKWGTYTII